jgi:hypothetical protein
MIRCFATKITKASRTSLVPMPGYHPVRSYRYRTRVVDGCASCCVKLNQLFARWVALFRGHVRFNLCASYRYSTTVVRYINRMASKCGYTSQHQSGYNRVLRIVYEYLNSTRGTQPFGTIAQFQNVLDYDAAHWTRMSRYRWSKRCPRRAQIQLASEQNGPF